MVDSIIVLSQMFSIVNLLSPFQRSILLPVVTFAAKEKIFPGFVSIYIHQIESIIHRVHVYSWGAMPSWHATGLPIALVKLLQTTFSTKACHLVPQACCCCCLVASVPLWMSIWSIISLIHLYWQGCISFKTLWTRQKYYLKYCYQSPYIHQGNYAEICWP